MSCAALALAASLALADLYGAGPAATPPPAGAPAVSALAQEPLFADIVSRARLLKTRAEAFRATPGLKTAPTAPSLADFGAFRHDAEALAALDMKGHLELKARGSDGDLKCILKGISEDLPRKLDEVAGARTGAQAWAALGDLAYLLDDNVGVITAPSKPPV